MDESALALPKLQHDLPWPAASRLHIPESRSADVKTNFERSQDMVGSSHYAERRCFSTYDLHICCGIIRRLPIKPTPRAVL